MKIVVGLLAALSFAGIAAAQPAPGLAPGAQPGPMMRIMHDPGPPPAMTGAAVVTPITFLHGMPTVSITVDGKGPFQVAFDTGAMGGLHISDAAAERAGLAATGEGLATDPTGKNPQRIKIYGRAQVGVGGRSFESFVSGAPVMGGHAAEFDGVMGLGVFGGALVTIDYAAGRLTAEPGSLPEPDSKTVFAYDGPLPKVTLSVEGRTLDAHLDTGNVRAAVFVPEGFAEGLSGHAAATPAGVGHTISTELQLYAVKLAAPATVGDVPLAATEALYPSVAPIGNVGSPALGGLVVRVDTLRRRVQVSAPAAAGKARSRS